MVGNHCVVGSGCLVQADPFASPFRHPKPLNNACDSSQPGQEGEPTTLMPAESGEEGTSEQDAQAAGHPESAAPSTRSTPADCLSDYTHVFGSENRRRKAGEEGGGQSRALFVKHWEYLRETLPRYHPLKMF